MTLQHHSTTCCSTLEPRSRLSLSLQPRSRSRRVDVHMATVKQTGLRTSVYLPFDLHGCDDVSQARTTADSRSPCGHPRHPLAFSRASRQQATLLSQACTPAQGPIPLLQRASRSILSVRRKHATGYRTYSSQVRLLKRCSSTAAGLRAQGSRTAAFPVGASQATVYIRPGLPSSHRWGLEMELRGSSRLEQCCSLSRPSRDGAPIFKSHLADMALGRCRSKPKQSSAGGLDMHAGLCSRSHPVWDSLQSGPGLVPGEG